MIEGALLAIGAAVIALVLAGTRSLGYGLLYLAFLPFLTLDPSQGGLVAVDGLQGGNVVWKLGVRAVATAGILVLGYRRRHGVLAILARPSSLPILGLYAWALIGLPRAQDPWVSFFRLGELLAFFVTGAVLAVEAERMRPGRVVRLHALALLPVLLSAIALAFLHPEIAFHESSSGLKRMGHKLMNSNVLGFAGTVVLLWSVSTLRGQVLHERAPRLSTGRRLREVLVPILAALIAGYVLYHARSRTASVAALGGVALLFMPWPAPRAALRGNGFGPGPIRLPSQHPIARRRRLALMAAAALGLLVVAMSFGAIETWFLRGGTLADVATGTGRTGLWKDLLLLQVPEAPLLGAGYLNLSATGGFEHAGHAWNNAHNAYLFALVSTGIPGFLCVLLIVALPLWASLRRAMWTSTHANAEDVREAALDQEAWVLVFALQSIVAVVSVTGFGVAGYPNVAMLFHYGLYAWVTSGVSASPRTLPALAPTARLLACPPADVPHTVR